MIIMFEVELAKLLGIIPPSTKKRKQPLEEEANFWWVLLVLLRQQDSCYVGSWLLSGKK